MSKHRGEGLMKQTSKGSFQKFEAISRDQFEDLMMEIARLQEENKERENKLKEELRNIKGPKKSLLWKNQNM